MAGNLLEAISTSQSAKKIFKEVIKFAENIVPQTAEPQTLNSHDEAGSRDPF